MDVKAKRLRREGYVVGNVFGREMKESIPVKMVKRDVEKLLKTDHKGSQIMLDVDGTAYDVLIKNVDYNPVAGQIDSIEFQALVSNEKVHSVAEIVLVNHEKIAEGVLQEDLNEVAYMAYPASLVDQVMVDVGEMKIGDVIRVKDLSLAADPDITIKTNPESIVVSLMASHNVEAPAEDTEYGLNRSDITHEAFSDNFAALCDRNKRGRLGIMNKPLKIDGLLDIHNRENDCPLLVGVSADGVVKGCAVIEILCDEIADRLRIVGDNRKKFIQLHPLNRFVNQQCFRHQTENRTKSG